MRNCACGCVQYSLAVKVVGDMATDKHALQRSCGMANAKQMIAQQSRTKPNMETEDAKVLSDRTQSDDFCSLSLSLSCLVFYQQIE